MAGENVRYLFVPEIELDGDAIVSVENSSGEREEAGRIVEQPVAPSSGSLPGGDIRLTLSGEPEAPHRDNTVRVTLPAVIDQGRFGWWREGDADIQLRQSMRVLGRLPAIVDRNTVAGATPYLVRPRALPLNNGDLFCAWLSSAANVPTNAVAGALSVKAATLSSDYSWSTVSTLPDLGRHTTLTDGLSGFGMTQYPDTGEIVLSTLENNIISGDRIMYTFVSQDDGASWIERRRLFFTGDLALTSGTTTDTTRPQDVDLQVLDNGRLVALIVTQEMAWSLVSDDRGRTWVVGALLDDWSLAANGGPVLGGTSSLTRLRNGLVFGAVSRPATLAGAVSGTHFVLGSFDGHNWSPRRTL